MESLNRWIDICLSKLTGDATGYSEKFDMEHQAARGFRPMGLGPNDD
jgi:hypothetical protein